MGGGAVLRSGYFLIDKIGFSMITPINPMCF